MGDYCTYLRVQVFSQSQSTSIFFLKQFYIHLVGCSTMLGMFSLLLLTAPTNQYFHLVIAVVVVAVVGVVVVAVVNVGVKTVHSFGMDHQ